MWGDYHAEGPSREGTLRKYSALSRDEVWDSLAWLYDGFTLPSAREQPKRAMGRRA